VKRHSWSHRSRGASKVSELSAKVDELAKANEELKSRWMSLSKITQELKAKSEKKALQNEAHPRKVEKGEMR